jgi:hypothetical protein
MAEQVPTKHQQHPLHDDLMRRLAVRNIPADRAPLPAEIRENMALAALRSVLAVHHPIRNGQGTRIVCDECRRLASPPPPGGGVWDITLYPCATVQAIAVAYGLTWPDQTSTPRLSCVDSDSDDTCG